MKSKLTATIEIKWSSKETDDLKKYIDTQVDYYEKQAFIEALKKYHYHGKTSGTLLMDGIYRHRFIEITGTWKLSINNIQKGKEEILKKYNRCLAVVFN